MDRRVRFADFVDGKTNKAVQGHFRRKSRDPNVLMELGKREGDGIPVGAPLWLDTRQRDEVFQTMSWMWQGWWEARV